MKMTRLEKRLVNRRRKAERNIEKVRMRLAQLDVNAIHDVLELGCGIGFVSAYLAETYDMNVKGTDFDPDQIEIAKKIQPQNDRLHFGVEDAGRLAFEDASFDLVLSQNVFHHISNWRAVVQEVTRVMRPGAYLLWLDIAFPTFIKTILRPFKQRYGLYSFAEVSAAFAAQGLKQRFYEKIAHGPFTHHHLVLQKEK